MYAILLLLRCSFNWYQFLPKSKFSDLNQKPWTIVHGFIFVRRKKVVRKVCHSEGDEKRNLMALVSAAYRLRVGSYERQKFFIDCTFEWGDKSGD